MKFYRKPIFIYTFVVVLAVVCAVILYLYFGETPSVEVPEVVPSLSMDRLLVDALNAENIDLQSVQRARKSDDIIYYQIPSYTEAEIVRLDATIFDKLTQNGITLSGVIKAEKVEQTKEYIDSRSQQKYVVEIYNPQARLAQAVSGKPQLCIVVDDFGNFDGPLIDAFCELDKEVTFAVIPGQPFTQSTMQKGVDSGHEVIVHMPWQPDGEANPGSNAILSTMSDRVIYDMVKGYFTEVSAANGANQHMGSLISADKRLMTVALKYLSERDLFFIDSRTTANTYGREVAEELGIAFEERNLNFLDAPENSDHNLAERLSDLKRLLETKSRALVITHCHDRGRLERLKTFISEAKKMGFELVPASKYVKSGRQVTDSGQRTVNRLNYALFNAHALSSSRALPEKRHYLQQFSDTITHIQSQSPIISKKMNRPDISLFALSCQLSAVG